MSAQRKHYLCDDCAAGPAVSAAENMSLVFKFNELTVPINSLNFPITCCLCGHEGKKGSVFLTHEFPCKIVHFGKRPLRRLSYSQKKALIPRRSNNTSISLYINTDLLAWLKSKGPGYGPRINRILQAAMIAGEDGAIEKKAAKGDLDFIKIQSRLLSELQRRTSHSELQNSSIDEIQKMIKMCREGLNSIAEQTMITKDSAEVKFVANPLLFEDKGKVH